MLGGVLPYQVDHIGTARARGAARGYDAGYYDGVFWPSVLYMWRAFDASDTLFKVSGLGWPTAHIRPPSRSRSLMPAAAADDAVAALRRRLRRRGPPPPRRGRRPRAVERRARGAAAAAAPMPRQCRCG